MTRVRHLLPAFHVGHAGMGDAAHVVDWAANLLTQGAVDSASGAESSSAQAAVGGAGAAGAAASGLGPVAGASGVRRGAARGVGSRAVLGRCGPEGEDFKASLALPLLRCCVQVSRRAGARAGALVHLGMQEGGSMRACPAYECVCCGSVHVIWMCARREERRGSVCLLLGNRPLTDVQCQMAQALCHFWVAILATCL